MSIFKELKAYTREFTRHWLQYLMLFLSLNLINQFYSHSALSLRYHFCLAGKRNPVCFVSKCSDDHYYAYFGFRNLNY